MRLKEKEKKEVFLVFWEGERPSCSFLFLSFLRS